MHSECCDQIVLIVQPARSALLPQTYQGQKPLDVIRGSLAAIGRDVLDADVAATPTVGVLVRSERAAGAIQVSASHNPPEYNGLKLFAPDGQVLPAADGEAVVKRFHESSPAWVDYRGIGDVQLLDDTTSEHIKLVLDTVRIFLGL